MKKTVVSILVAFMAFVQMAAQEGYDSFEVQVDGLGCPFCAYGLEKKFKEFKGIKDVKIDIETGNFTFNYPSEKNLSLEAVEKQVEKAGYTPVAGSVTRVNGSMEAMHSPSEAKTLPAVYAKASTKVAGNCEMCEARIEKAALQLEGVYEASWDKESKLLNLSYDESKVSPEAVEKSIAQAGHDTEHHKARVDTYENLPACCKYERIASNK